MSKYIETWTMYFNYNQQWRHCLCVRRKQLLVLHRYHSSRDNKKFFNIPSERELKEALKLSNCGLGLVKGYIRSNLCPSLSRVGNVPRLHSTLQNSRPAMFILALFELNLLKLFCATFYFLHCRSIASLLSRESCWFASRTAESCMEVV